MQITVSIPLRSIMVLGVLLAYPSLAPAQDGNHAHAGGILTPPPNAGFKPPPSPLPPVETPTTLIFFQNSDSTGASYSVQLKPPQAAQGTRIIPTSELTGAGMVGNISAVRIACGTRPSRASLFDVDWGEFSKGTMIECAAGQTTDINLGDHELNKKINSAALVVHVRSTDNLPHAENFSTFLSSVWRTQVLSLSAGATAKGTRIWLDDFQDLHIQQMLEVDSPYCTARGAVFEIRINLTVANYKPIFKGYAVSQYVDSGFGDLWGCHRNMMRDLGQGVGNAITSLQAQLPTLVLNLGPESPTYYFAPQGTTSDYDLFVYK